VPLVDLLALAAVAFVCTAVHALFTKELVFVSFDPETAAALGYDTRRWDGLLFGTLGLAIPVAARALGALPVFAFLTIPAAAALLVVRRLRTAFLLAAAIGLAAAAGGYLVSWFLQIPTGATMVVLAGIFALPGVALRRR
jgi:zinc transport system permease protein